MFKDFSQPNNTQAQAEATFPREYKAILQGNPEDSILVLIRHKSVDVPLEALGIPRKGAIEAWKGFLSFKESTPALMQVGFYIEFIEFSEFKKQAKPASRGFGK
jgi:hypothetical protein